jgi:hypothetical protein
VHGSADFAGLAPALPPPMPDWSPVRARGGYQPPPPMPQMATACGCGKACGVHGHDHAQGWGAEVPTSDARSFWGALGCACWAV